MDDIRNRRLALGLSQRALSVLVGVHESTVYNWENGGRRMTPGIVGRVEAILSALEAGEEPPAPTGVLPHNRQKIVERIPAVTQFIRNYLLRHHMAPSLTEIDRGVGFPARRVLEEMEKRGMIARSWTPDGNPRARSIRLTGKGAT